MSITNVGLAWDRISSVVAGEGFTRSKTAFDFDLQPDGALDTYYHMTTERIGTIPYLGGAQSEHHRVTMFLARRAKRDQWGAARQLKADMDLLESLFAFDYPGFDYVILDDEIDSRVEQPVGGDFVVGRLEFVIDLDRPTP